MTWFFLFLMFACNGQTWGPECSQPRQEVSKAAHEGIAYSTATKRPECFSKEEREKISQDYFDKTCETVEEMLFYEHTPLSMAKEMVKELERLLAEEPALNTTENLKRFADIKMKMKE